MFTRRTLLKSGAALAAASTMTGLAKPAFAAGTKIKIGYVSPQSGPLSAFSAADDFMVKKFLDSVTALGLDAEHEAGGAESETEDTHDERELGFGRGGGDAVVFHV